jgi:hypothetical protein
VTFWRRHETALLWVVFGAVGLLVVAPWIGTGWLLLLDWGAGPRASLTPSAYGIDASQVDAMPVRLAIAGLRQLVGPSAAAWVAVWLVFPIGGAGMARLVGGPTVRRLAAGSLFLINPFVLDRVRVGHVLLLLGYALVPWALASFLDARAEGRVLRVRSAAWLALLISISPHLAWLGGVLLLATLAWPRPSIRDLAGAVGVVVGAVSVTAYAVALHASGVQVRSPGRADLDAFATAGADVPAQVANALALSGFWRDARGPAEVVGPLWLLVLVGVLAVVVVGLRAGWSQPASRSLVVSVGLAGGIGLLLAGGDRGIVGPLYGVLFDQVPLFAVMREPQKWLALTALAYAVGFGFGVEALASAVGRRIGDRPKVGVATAAALVALPVLLAPNLFWGVGGEVRTSRYPASWAEAETLMGSGEESILFLPWHQYQPFGFTQGRTVATPAAAYFSRPVIGGDDAELPGGAGATTSPRSQYVEALLARTGRIRHLGRLLAPLGVRYVVAVPGDGEARWLAAQEDLQPVLVERDLVVYRNEVRGTGRVAGVQTVADLDAAIDLAESGRQGDAAIVVAPAAASSPRPGEGTGGLERRNVVTYDLAEGEDGWVVVPEPANVGWRLDGRPGRETVSGVLAFRSSEPAAVIGYRPWRFVLGGYLVSTVALVGLLALGLFEHRGRLTRAVRPAPSKATAS